MKKILSIIFATLLILAASISIYRFGFRKSIPNAPESQQVVSILQQNGCFVCHTSDAKKPFYASWPAIGKKVTEQFESGERFADLEGRTSDIDNIDEVTLAMIDHSITSGSMPPANYKLANWGTGFNRNEKSVLAQWVRNVRTSRFSNGLACAEMQNEPIYPIPYSVGADEAKAALGERMFNDERLSKDGTITCATCHILEQGGADEEDERVSKGINDLSGNVNAPTVFNAVFNIRQFWNGRAADLQEQAGGPATNPVEMGDQTLEDIVLRLKADKALAADFETLYPGEGLTPNTLTAVIAEFEKTLLTPDSKFDKYLKGDKNALSKEELKGYVAFKESACATCHTGVLMGGQSFESLNVYGDWFSNRDKSIEYSSDDDGLKGFTGKDSDYRKFKVPGLRNVAKTAPYMHDGTVLTMEEAVRVMAEYELGKTLDEETVASIVAFMSSLTGESKYF